MKRFSRPMPLFALVILVAGLVVSGCSRSEPGGGSAGVAVDPGRLYGQVSEVPDQTGTGRGQPTAAGATGDASISASAGRSSPAASPVRSDRPAWASADDDGVPWGPGLVPDIMTRFRPTAERLAVIGDAENAAIKACVEDKGFIAWGRQRYQDNSTGNFSMISDVESSLGLLDPDQAKVWGYAVGVSTAPTDEPKPIPSPPAGYLEQDQDTLDQANQECATDPAVNPLASVRPVNDGKDLSNAIHEMQARANAAAAAALPVKDAIAQWSTCMGRSGYSYDRPMEPFQEYSKDRSPC